MSFIINRSNPPIKEKILCMGRKMVGIAFIEIFLFPALWTYIITGGLI